MYTINVGDFTVGETIYHNRCLSASIGGIGIQSDVIPWAETEHNPWDYKYENEQFILDVIEIPVPVPIPTREDKIEANVDYIAMMTGVELPEEDE